MSHPARSICERLRTVRSEASRVVPLVAAFCSTEPSLVQAGMPSARWVVTEMGDSRLGVISFFLMGLLASALGVKWIWNALCRDFPNWPRLTFWRSLGLVALWGAAFVLVLTMISGARELMTPRAWKPVGATYRLADDQSSAQIAAAEPSDALAARRRKLEKLRFALWQYAVDHDGRFPASREESSIPDEVWGSADISGMRCVYYPGHTPRSSLAILAAEPDLFGENRLAILTSGAIVAFQSLSDSELPMPLPETRVWSGSATSEPAIAEIPESPSTERGSP